MKNKKTQDEYQDFNQLIDEAKKDFSGYLDKRLQLAKLKVYEKFANFSSRLLYGMIILVFSLILFFLFFITLGLYFGYLLNNYSAGFGIVILICLFFLLISILCRKVIRRFFVNLSIRTLKNIESDEE